MKICIVMFMTDLLLPFAFQFVVEVLHLIQLYWLEFDFVVPKTVTTFSKLMWFSWSFMYTLQCMNDNSIACYYGYMLVYSSHFAYRLYYTLNITIILLLSYTNISGDFAMDKIINQLQQCQHCQFHRTLKGK